MDPLVDALRGAPYGVAGPQEYSSDTGSVLSKLVAALWGSGLDLSKRAIQGADVYARTGDPSAVVGPAAETAINMFGIGGPAAMVRGGASMGAAGGRTLGDKLIALGDDKIAGVGPHGPYYDRYKIMDVYKREVGKPKHGMSVGDMLDGIDAARAKSAPPITDKATTVEALGGALPDTPKATSVGLPSLRGIPRDEAIAIAKTEPHLIKGGAGTEGYYVGGPRNVQTPADLMKIRSDYDAFVAKDPRGGDWYDRTQRNINEVTGGDPTQNTWMSRQHQVWSAGVSPESEIAFALRENNGALAGMPEIGHYPAQHDAHMRAIAAGDPNLYPGGYKTGSYGQLIDPNLPNPPGAVGTNDFRAARNWGYTEPDGTPKTGMGITANQSRFMDYETALAVDRLNQQKVGGIDWTGERAQAAPWVRQKAEALMEKRGMPYEQAFGEANKTIGDYFDKHTFNATHEAWPGASTGHLPQSIGADQATRVSYAQDPRSTWAIAPGGRDAIYAGMNIPNTGVAMRVRPTTEMQGMFEGGFNPGWSARPLVAFAPGGGSKTMAAGDRALMEAGEATRGFIDAQDAAAGHINWQGGPTGESTSVFARMPGKATPEQMQAAQSIGTPAGLTDVVDTGRGLTMTNFGGGVDPKVLSKALKGGLGDNVVGATGASDVARVKTDPVYIDYTDAWKAGQGSDAATTQLLSYVERTPEIKAALNNNPMIAQKALGNLERDAEYAAQLGVTREDIQMARQIISDGPGWIDRLKANLGKGILPAIGAFVLQQASSEQQPVAH